MARKGKIEIGASVTVGAKEDGSLSQIEKRIDKLSNEEIEINIKSAAKRLQELDKMEQKLGKNMVSSIEATRKQLTDLITECKQEQKLRAENLKQIEQEVKAAKELQKIEEKTAKTQKQKTNGPTKREQELADITKSIKGIRGVVNTFDDSKIQKTEEKVRKLIGALDEYQTKLDAMKRLRKGNERTMYDTAKSEIADLKRALGAIQAVKDQTPSIKPKIEKREKEIEQEKPKKTVAQQPKAPVVGAGDSAKSIQDQTAAIEQQTSAMESLGKSTEKAAKQVGSIFDPVKQKKYTDYINAQIKDTERSIRNQQDWIRHLGWVFDDGRFASSGKKDAYDKLKLAAMRYNDASRRKTAGTSISEDEIELATIAWKKAYDEAVKQGVAERRLYDYKPPMWNYDSSLQRVQGDYDYRKKTLERDEVQLTSLKQIQENIEGFAQLCDVLGEYRQCVKDINSDDKSLAESAAQKLEGIKKNLRVGIDIKDHDKQNALIDIKKKLRADGYSIEQIATDYVSRIGFLGGRVNKELEAPMQKLFETPNGQISMFEGMADPVFETVEATNELAGALKNVEQIAGQISFDEYIKDIKDIVYHAGDLSNIDKTIKSLTLGHVKPQLSGGVYQGKYQPGSIFNGLTGLYTTEDLDSFIGNEWTGAPISSIDISKYKLFKPGSNEIATRVMDFFDELNGTIYGYLEYFDMDQPEMQVRTDVKPIGELYSEMQAIFGQVNVTVEEFTKWVNDSKAAIKGYKFVGREQPVLDEGISKVGYGTVLDSAPESLINADSFQTQLMKMLGFEGIDLRGTKYNGTYTGGTVIFDIKPESLKAVNEKYSDVMVRNGLYSAEEAKELVEFEEKRRQLAFETAKAYSKQVPIQPTVELNAVGAAIEESTGGVPVEVSVTPVVEKAEAAQVPNDIINQLVKGTNIEQLLSKYGIPSNKFDTGVDLFKDLAGALYQEDGKASGEKVNEAFAQLTDFIEKNAERTEQVNKTLEEFYNYMSQVQIRIPENMEKAFEAENPDDWKRIKKLYSIGGNYQNKKRLITTSKYASTPDVLLEELLANGFGAALGVDTNFNGSAQDSLRLILDAVQKAKDEAKLGKTQKIIGLDVETQAAMYTDLSEAASVVEQNYKALSAATSAVNVSNDDAAESAEQAREALENQAIGAEHVANAMRGLQEQEQGDKKTAPPIGSDSKQPANIINKATRDALEQLRRASDNKTTFIDLSGVNSVGELEKQISSMAQAIVGSELKVDSVIAQDGIARIALYNEQLGITASQMWRLQEATEDANKAQLELISQTEKYSPRAAQRYSVAQQAKIDKDNRWLISQMGALDKKEFSYKYSNKKISGDTEILYPDEKYFGKTIDELAKNIRERIENSMDGALTEVIRNEILDVQRILDSEIKVAQANKYVKGKLSAQEVVEAKATREYELDAFEERAKKENVFTQLKGDIKAMRDELAGVTGQDSSGLDRFVDKMRTAKAHLTLETTKQSSIKQELRNYDQATKAQDRLYNAKKRLAKLEAEGKTDKELSRNIDELNERYKASINVLQGEKQIADILKREATLEAELKNIRATAESEQAKRAKATEDKKFSDQLKSFYSSWIKILGEINDADSQINKLALQDKGTGLYTNRIQDAQTTKSAKIAELRTLQEAINRTLSFDGTGQDSGFNGFLKYCRENAILTTEEIQKLNNALIKSDYIAQDFAIESANQKLKEQKEIYTDLLAAVKKYNEADYNWQQADISGGNKGPYNDQMNLYLRQIDAAVSRMDKNGYELSLEQEVELNKINNEHLQRKNKLLEEAASKEQKYNQQASDITSKVWSQIDQWEKDHSFTRIFSDELQSEILAFADSLSNLDQKTNFTALGKQWDQIVAKTQKATEANQAYIDSRWKDRFQNDYQYYSMPSSYDDGQFYVYGNGKTRQDQGVLDQMADYYRQEAEKAEKFGENIQDVYKRLMEASKSYNAVSEKMSSIALKDNGTGLYSKTLENLQDQKSALRGEISALGQEITDMLSLDTISASNPFKAFFEDTRVQAALTTEEITKFQDVLSQMDSGNFNFISKVAEKVQSFVENLKLLSEMLSKGVIDGKSDKNVGLVGNILKTNEGYSKLWGQFKEQPDAGNASELFKFVNANEQYINSVIKAASAEAKYFESKKQYANIANMQDYDASAKSMDNMSEGAKNAKESLESFVKSFTDGKGIITDFTTSANGISKINFGVLEEGTNQFRTFSAEMGTFTDKVYTYETSMKNMTAGTEAAKKALASMSQVMSRLNGNGFTVDNNDYVKSLYEKMQSLRDASTKTGTSKDAVDQSKLQNMANDANRLIKIVNQLENAYLKMNEAADGENVLTGDKLDTTKDMYTQMVDQAEKMRQATNSTSVSIDGFDKVTKKLTFTLEDTDGQAKTFVMTMDKLSKVATAQVKSIDQVKTGWQEFTSGIGDVGKQLLQYGLRMVEVYDIIRYLRQGFNEVLEIDTAMTELKKVTDETAVAYDNFAKSAYASSKKIGSTMKEFIQATADFARLGYSIDEASQLAEAANVYKNVGDGIDDVAQASESIISTMKAFNIEATDSMGIVDRFNEIKITCLHIW